MGGENIGLGVCGVAVGVTDMGLGMCGVVMVGAGMGLGAAEVGRAGFLVVVTLIATVVPDVAATVVDMCGDDEAFSGACGLLACATVGMGLGAA